MATNGSGPTMKKTLGLTGVTVNAMALIAPGAFLWMTYQLQAASADSHGASTAMDMWVRQDKLVISCRLKSDAGNAEPAA